MRISDWSSDVCSSDLTNVLPHDDVDTYFHTTAGADEGIRTDARIFAYCATCAQAGNYARSLNYCIWPDINIISQHDSALGKTINIGRASCRERVCKYV